MLEERDRRQKQADAVAREVMQGARVESNADYQAVMVGGGRINHLLHFFVGLFTCGWWWIVWVFLALTGGEKRYIVRTDEFGNTLVEKGKNLAKGIIAAVIAGAILLFIFLMILGATVLNTEEDVQSSSSPRATATPVVPVATVTMRQLLAEREANATRYDDTYRGNWVAISGIVERIDDSLVYLEGDGFLGGGTLAGLPRDEQAALDIGQSVTYTCRVGDYSFGTISMHQCQ